MTTANLLTGPSAEQLRRLETDGGLEYVNGQLLEKPVSVETGRIESRILRLLGNEAERTRHGEAFASGMAYRCYAEDPARYRRPDVSVVRQDRLAAVDVKAGFMPVPADLVVEVVSPNDLAYDVIAKVDEYLRNGFPLVWVVHPNTRAVTIHRGDGSIAMLHENDEITGEAALPTFRCKVGEFFPAAP